MIALQGLDGGLRERDEFRKMQSSGDGDNHKIQESASPTAVRIQTDGSRLKIRSPQLYEVSLHFL